MIHVNITDIIRLQLEKEQVDKDEKCRNVIINCIKELVVYPLIDLLSVLEVIIDYASADLNPESNPEQLKMQVRYTLFGRDNKKFAKVFYQDQIVPDAINEIFISNYKKTVVELTEIFFVNEDFQNMLELNKNRNLQIWASSDNEKEVEVNKKSRTRTIQDVVYVDNKKTFYKSFSEKRAEEKELDKKRKKLTRTEEKKNKLFDLKFASSIKEIIKEDDKRFDNIFDFISIKNIPTARREAIKELWYGKNLYAHDHNGTDILSIISKYNISIKIQHDQINTDVNRLILQTYIVCLYESINIRDIYSIVYGVSSARETGTQGFVITPSIIYNNNGVPSTGVQEVLNPIINNLNLSGDLEIIRINWENMKNPIVDVTDFMNFIADTDELQTEVKFSIIVAVEDLLGDEVLIRHKARFVKKVSEILKIKNTKLILKEKDLIQLIKHEI